MELIAARALRDSSPRFALCDTRSDGDGNQKRCAFALADGQLKTFPLVRESEEGDPLLIPPGADVVNPGAPPSPTKSAVNLVAEAELTDVACAVYQ